MVYFLSPSHGDDWLTITGVSQADKPLSPSYQLYNYTGANTTEVILRTISYALPAVHAHVRTVALTTCFAPQRRSSSSSCECDVEGARRKSYVPVATGYNVLGVLGLDNARPGGDIQYAGAIAYHTPYVFHNTGGWLQRVGNQQAPNDAYLVWLDYIKTRSPCVATVGGTMRYSPMIAIYMSRGGFSIHFHCPIHQDGGVPLFFEYLAIEYAGFHNPEGLGIPNISAQARKIQHHISHRLGSLNSLLYGLGRYGLNDITSGSGSGRRMNGFTAIPRCNPARNPKQFLFVSTLID
ncbi:hypothetical protein H4582DRAFT_2058295 [Lactarius indigo]|nr:hypothetical protein H4582DRAFT_2058295 [Lactarius indigo]